MMNNLCKLFLAALLIGLSLCGFKFLVNVIASTLSAVAFIIGFILLITAVKSFVRDYLQNK